MAISTPEALWSRTDSRSRRWSLIVLAILCGVTAGLAFAAFDGASRTGSALDRLEARSNASDAVVFSSQVESAQPDWTKLSQRPEVRQIARWGLVFGLVDGFGDGGGVLFVPTDDVFMQQVDRPVVVEGRMFDPDEPTEMIITDDDQDGVGWSLGDVIHFDAFGTPLDAAPVPIDLTIVGVVHTSLAYEFTGGAFISPAFVRAYGDRVGIYENAMISLRNGSADVAALRRDASTDVGTGVPVLDLQVTARRVTATTDVEQAMLMLLGAVIAIAAVTFVGQALARSAAAIATDAPTLRALGMTRRQLTLAAVRPHLPVAALASGLSVVTAAVASRWFPVGLAAEVDPDRGIQIAALPALAMAAAVALLVVAGVGMAGWLAVGPNAEMITRRQSLVSRLGLGRHVTIGVGVRMALERGPAAVRGSSRSALIGAVAAVAGIVAIMTLDQGLTDSLRNPAVAGVAWDATVAPAQSDIEGRPPSRAELDAILSQPGLSAIGSIGRLVSNIDDVGVPTFTVFTLDPTSRSTRTVELVTLTGHPPRADDEITLGPSTARDLGVEIGDSVELADRSPATVVGLGLFPADVHAQFDEGAAVSNARYDSLTTASGAAESPDHLGPGFLIAVRFGDRAGLDKQISALNQALGSTGLEAVSVEQPLELTNLHHMQRLPLVLAVFLTILGAAAVGHALFSSVRHRRRDFAVMRALGVTRGGSRMVLAAQGSTVAVVGILFGVPIGLIAGRSGWRAITDRVPLIYRSPVALVAIMVIAPLVLVAANALAVIPGRRAARIDPALVLRSE
ncbi:MAG: FtsX-like permease family protein [Ilumatobacteraceae bacterium]